MQLFISYSSKDSTSVKPLIRDLEAARHAVWVDQELTGGDSWWREILQQIQQCDVFVLALSNNSLRSKPCMAELNYAEALGLPVVPVQIGPVDRPRLSPIAHIQIIDYRESTPTVGITLVAALQDGAAQRGELPDPPPDPPPIPYEYLMRLSMQIDSPALQHAEQVAIVAQLRDSLEIEEDNDVRADLDTLLRRLRSRLDVTFRVASEIDTVLRQYNTTAAQNSTATPRDNAPAVRPAPAPQPQDGTWTSRPGLMSHQTPPITNQPLQRPRRGSSPSRVPPLTSPPTQLTNEWRSITATALGTLSAISLFLMEVISSSFISIVPIAIISLITGIAGIGLALMAKLRDELLANGAIMISIGWVSLTIILILVDL